MDIAKLSFNKQGSDLALERNAVAFRAGDMVEAVVKAVDEGWALIGFKNQDVLAQTVLPLEKGQRLFLVVDKVEEGKVYLKVLDLKSKGFHANELAIRELTQKLGLPDDPFYVEIVKGMIANRLAVTSENIRVVNRMVSLLGGRESEEAIKLAFWLLTRNNEITSAEAGKALMSFFETEPSEIIDYYRAIVQLLSADSEGIPSLNEGTLSSLETSNSNQSYRADMIPVGNDVPRRNILSGLNGRNVDESRKSISQDLMRLILPDLYYLMALSKDRTKTAGSIKDLLTEQIKVLMEMDSAGWALTNQEETLLNQFHHAVDRIRDHFTGQTIYNYLENNAADSTKTLYFLVPFTFQQDLRYAELTVSWTEKDRKRDAPTDRLSINIGVQTTNLGRIVFHLLVDGNKMGIGVYLEQEQSKAVIDKEMPALIDGLKEMGYYPQYLGSQVVSNLKIKPDLKTAVWQDRPLMNQLDIRI